MANVAGGKRPVGRSGSVSDVAAGAVGEQNYTIIGGHVIWGQS